MRGYTEVDKDYTKDINELVDYTLITSLISFIAMLLLPIVRLEGSLDGTIRVSGYRIEALGTSITILFLDNLQLYMVPLLVAETVNAYYLIHRFRGMEMSVEEWGSLLIINVANVGYTLGFYKGLTASISSIPVSFVYETNAGHIIYPPGIIEWNKAWLISFWVYVGTSILTALIITYPAAKSFAHELQRKINKRRLGRIHAQPIQLIKDDRIPARNTIGGPQSSSVI